MIKLESATHIVAIKRFKLVLHFACVYLPIRNLNTQNMYILGPKSINNYRKTMAILENIVENMNSGI